MHEHVAAQTDMVCDLRQRVEQIICLRLQLGWVLPKQSSLPAEINTSTAEGVGICKQEAHFNNKQKAFQ